MDKGPSQGTEKFRAARLTALIGLLYFHVLKKLIPWRKLRILVPKKLVTFVHSRPGSWLLHLGVVAAISVFLLLDTAGDRQRLVSAGGVAAILGAGAVFSTSRTSIRWRHVTWGLALQFVFGLLILRWRPGKMFFDCIGDKV